MDGQGGEEATAETAPLTAPAAAAPSGPVATNIARLSLRGSTSEAGVSWFPERRTSATQQPFSVCVPEMYDGVDNNKRECKIYSVLLAHNGQSWVIPASLDELQTLSTKLQEAYPMSQFPQFPSRGMFEWAKLWSEDENTRRSQLERWLQIVLSNERYLYSNITQQFLSLRQLVEKDELKSMQQHYEHQLAPAQPALPSQRHAYEDRPYLRHPQNAQHHSPSHSDELRPLQTAHVPLPSLIRTHRGDTVYLLAIVEHIRQTLLWLLQIQQRLRQGGGMRASMEDRLQARVALLAEMKEKLDRQAAVLWEEREVLLAIQHDASVAWQPGLADYIQYCAHEANAAVQWIRESENLILRDLDQPGHLQQSDHDRLRRLESEVQLILDRVSADSEAELRPRLDKLLADLDTEIALRQAEDTRERLLALKSLADSIDLSNVRVDDSLRAHITSADSMEALLFELLAEVGEFEKISCAPPLSLDTPPTKDEAPANPPTPLPLPTRAVELHQRMRQLMRDLQSLHAAIKEPIVTAAVQSSAGREAQRLLNRVEDLQENLAELEYNFSSRYEIEQGGLGEMAEHKLKELRVVDARKSHERASDDLFEL